MKSHDKNSRAILGLILIAVGTILITVNLGWIPHAISDWIVSWQMLLIVIGLVLMATKTNKGPGIVLILIGGFFIAIDYFDNIYYMHKLFWPSLIIFVGIMFLFRGKKGHVVGHSDVITDNDFIDDISIFGGGNKIITAKNFKGGKITSVFGGSTIDFSQANLANGVSEIDVVSLFGGSKLIVPRDWDIHLEVTAIFGGFADKRIVDPHIIHNPSKKLIIKGVAIFGGGELNYL